MIEPLPPAARCRPGSGRLFAAKQQTIAERRHVVVVAVAAFHVVLMMAMDQFDVAP